MIMKKICLALFVVLSIFAAKADALFQDSLNYPYVDGCIEGQGQWYCYYPKSPNLNTFVTNNVLYLVSNTTNDSVATPTNGWVNSTEFNFASFSINVSQLPTGNGTYFCQLQETNDYNDCCHVFIDTHDTQVPGTYRLGIANFDTSVSTIVPPVDYPLDLATGITYTVVILFDTNQDDTTFVGATLWINPSEQDYQNVVDAGGYGPDPGPGFVYGLDTTSSQSLQDINISQIGFSPYVNAGISNVIAGNTFDDVNTTNLPVIGIQPQSQTNYSGNDTVFYTAASGVDLSYQWYSTSGGILSDGPNISGSTTNILEVNNLSTSDNYYVVVTDTYGKTTSSATATNTVITTPTAPFFTDAPLNLTNNLFTSFGLTNIAKGTGPLTYQWYFAPTNTPTIFTLLGGQTASGLTVSELAYTNTGNYYVLAHGPDGDTAGPTNSLVVVPPLIATLPQLHELMGTLVTNITAANEVYINSNGLSVSGYVTVFGPFTASTKTYAEFYVGYQNYGTYVYYASAGTNAIPAPGSYVTVSGPCEVYHGQLEVDPGANGVVISNSVPVQMPAPQLVNAAQFAQLATNTLSPYGVQVQCSLVTITNVYIYGDTTGDPYTANGGVFYTNGYTKLYITEGSYSSPGNTNYITLYCPAYGGIATNLWGQIAPNHAYQVTGVMAVFGSGGVLYPELDLTRLDDIVSNTPAAFAVTLAKTNNKPAVVSWPVVSGSTYSFYSATNLAGPWAQTFGLSYYPTNGIFTDTNSAPAKFYRVSSP
jgi:hypothetical protein